MYDLSCSDGLNDFSMLIDSTRYRPFIVCTWDRTAYSLFLNIDARQPVGHDETIISSFDIPCNLWPVLASLVLAGICFILHWNSFILIDVWIFLTDTIVKNDLGSSLNFQSFISVDSLIFNLSRFEWTWCVSFFWSLLVNPKLHVNWCIWVSNCSMVSILLIFSHYTHLTSLALTVHPVFP